MDAKDRMIFGLVIIYILLPLWLLLFIVKKYDMDGIKSVFLTLAFVFISFMAMEFQFKKRNNEKLPKV
jgi:hypothetical protein